MKLSSATKAKDNSISEYNLTQEPGTYSSAQDPEMISDPNVKDSEYSSVKDPDYALVKDPEYSSGNKFDFGDVTTLHDNENYESSPARK